MNDTTAVRVVDQNIDALTKCPAVKPEHSCIGMQGQCAPVHILPFIEELINDEPPASTGQDQSSLDTMKARAIDPATAAFMLVDIHASTSDVLPLPPQLAHMKSDFPNMSLREQIVRNVVLEEENGVQRTWQWVRGCNHVGGYENAPHWVDRHPCNG